MPFKIVEAEDVVQNKKYAKGEERTKAQRLQDRRHAVFMKMVREEKARQKKKGLLVKQLVKKSLVDDSKEAEMEWLDTLEEIKHDKSI